MGFAAKGVSSSAGKLSCRTNLFFSGILFFISKESSSDIMKIWSCTVFNNSCEKRYCPCIGKKNKNTGEKDQKCHQPTPDVPTASTSAAQVADEPEQQWSVVTKKKTKRSNQSKDSNQEKKLEDLSQLARGVAQDYIPEHFKTDGKIKEVAKPTQIQCLANTGVVGRGSDSDAGIQDKKEVIEEVTDEEEIYFTPPDADFEMIESDEVLTAKEDVEDDFQDVIVSQRADKQQKGEKADTKTIEIGVVPKAKAKDDTEHAIVSQKLKRKDRKKKTATETVKTENITKEESEDDLEKLISQKSKRKGKKKEKTKVKTKTTSTETKRESEGDYQDLLKLQTSERKEKTETEMTETEVIPKEDTEDDCKDVLTFESRRKEKAETKTVEGKASAKEETGDDFIAAHKSKSKKKNIITKTEEIDVVTKQEVEDDLENVPSKTKEIKVETETEMVKTAVTPREDAEDDFQEFRSKRKERRMKSTVSVEKPKPLKQSSGITWARWEMKNESEIVQRQEKSVPEKEGFLSINQSSGSGDVNKQIQNKKPILKTQEEQVTSKKLTIYTDTSIEKSGVLNPSVEEVKIKLVIPQKTSRCGSRGYPIQIETNHLVLKLGRLEKAVHYDVTIVACDGDSKINSEKDAVKSKMPKKLLRGVMGHFQKQFFKDCNPAYDGSKNLYSPTELPFGQHISGKIKLDENGRTRLFAVVIKFANIVDFAPLWKFVNANFRNNNRHLLTPQEAIQCLDIVLRNAPSMSCIQAGRCFFLPPRIKIIPLGSGMQLCNGFYQSVVAGSKPYLNIDVAHKAFPLAQNVIDLIIELCGRKPPDLQVSLKPEEVDIVNRFIRTLKVIYEIANQPASKREYTVNSIDKSAADALFISKEGIQLSVQQYFFESKGITLKYPHMPCVCVIPKNKTRILLPAEFCTVREGQLFNKKLPDKVTNSIIKQTATSTAVRKQKIVDSIQKAAYNKDSCVKEFGISVDERFISINARVLKPPELSYNGNVTVKPNCGEWKPFKFYSGAALSRWSIISLDSYVPKGCLEQLAKLIYDYGKCLGMSIEDAHRPFCILQLPYRKELENLKQLLEKKKYLQLIIVVIPNSDQYYNYVKQAAELFVGCLTQCIKSTTIRKINVSIVKNMLQKINAKLQGINHILDNRTEWMKKAPYMIMGADVTHPGPEAKDKPSIAAVTASFDLGAFKYHLRWCFQPPTVEIIEDLENITEEHLHYFYRNTNGKMPERIIFFRDGVSEGQFSAVMNTEIQAIRRACYRLYSYTPKITFLVVQKRHHTRFFPENPKDASEDKNLNVPVGTCVDTDIVHPTALDFYLVSHYSIQGVARPTKYRVLWDDAEMSWDEIEELAFHFCHIFSRCTRSVSYPVPTYYAHLAAARIMAYCGNTKLDINDLPKEQRRMCINAHVTEKNPMFFV